MKRLLFLSIVMGFALRLNAQTETRRYEPIPMQALSVEKTADLQVIPHDASRLGIFIPKRTHKSNVNYTPFGDVLSTTYAAPVVGVNNCIWGGGNPYSDTYTLFPDSLAISHFAITNNPSQSFNEVHLAAIGFTFDPYSMTYDSWFSSMLFPNNTPAAICGYRIDTLTVFGDYRIANYNPSSPDTLRIFITSHHAYNGLDPLVGNEYFRLSIPPYNPNLVTPIVQYGNMVQKGSVVKPVANSLAITDYILSPNDSVGWQLGSIYCRPINVPVYYEVPVGCVSSIVMKFIPGYSYVNRDTIQKTYYNTSIPATTGKEVRKNVFSAAVISDNSDFLHFCDQGGGFNCRLAESMGIRYNTSNLFLNPSYNPQSYNAYAYNYYAIPYVLMTLSTGDDWWNPNQPIYTVTGRVTESGNPVSGVRINCDNGRSALTDASGDYTIAVDSGTTVILTPVLSGYVFTPPSITCNNVNTNLTNQDFTAAFVTYAVTGRVTVNGNPLAGVTINCTNGNSNLTNANGEYTISVNHGSSVTLTPVLARYDFTPPSITCNNVTANVPNQDFEAEFIPMTYSIYGKVTQDGNPFSGVTITCTNGASAVTNISGDYTIIVDSNATETITPVLAGYAFTPPYITLTNVLTDVYNRDFSIVQVNTVSGRITLNDNPFPGVTITYIIGDENAGDTVSFLTTTDANGEYAVTVESGVTVTIRPSMAGYDFKPKARNYPGLSSNYTNENFTAFVSEDGISEPKRVSNFTVYPNPTNYELKIANYEGGTIEIFSITGQNLMTINTLEPIESIDISHLAKGIYYLRISGEVFKVIKN